MSLVITSQVSILCLSLPRLLYELYGVCLERIWNYKPLFKNHANPNFSIPVWVFLVNLKLDRTMILFDQNQDKALQSQLEDFFVLLIGFD